MFHKPCLSYVVLFAASCAPSGPPLAPSGKVSVTIAEYRNVEKCWDLDNEAEGIQLEGELIRTPLRSDKFALMLISPKCQIDEKSQQITAFSAIGMVSIVEFEDGPEVNTKIGMAENLIEPHLHEGVINSRSKTFSYSAECDHYQVVLHEVKMKSCSFQKIESSS